MYKTVAPLAGAWIEIVYCPLVPAGEMESPPSRGAWIEILARCANAEREMSPPSRGAWIEISI